jgi:hypothetical protein
MLCLALNRATLGTYDEMMGLVTTVHAIALLVPRTSLGHHSPWCLCTGSGLASLCQRSVHPQSDTLTDTCVIGASAHIPMTRVGREMQRIKTTLDHIQYVAR